jgi:RNA recognition motif-containing protein
MATISLVDDLSKLLLDDPLVQSLWDGTMAWGDIPGILNNERRSSIVSEASIDSDTSDASEDSIDITLIASFKHKIPKTFNKQVEPASKPKNIVVPSLDSVIPRRTIIAKNLPRDIKVEQLVQQIRMTFEKYGPIRDVYLPPNKEKNSPYFGTIKGFAKIEFGNISDSINAFQNEYGRLKIGRNNIQVQFANEDRERN